MPRQFVRVSFILMVLTVMVSLYMVATADDAPPPGDSSATDFEFWIGEWDLSWPGEQTGLPAGTIGKGFNTIQPVLNDKVIAESFRNGDSSFVGQSWSVFSPAEKKWRQTWVDNSGGYIVLSGGMSAEEMILQTEPIQRGGQTYISRMVFGDIEADAFTWRWQRSVDEGESWEERWTIDYRRRKSD